MSTKLRIVLAQLNLPVGDISGNLKKHLEAASKARDELKADVIVFPEMSLTGYPPEDLLLRPAFIAEAESALEQFNAKIKDIYCLIGHPSIIKDSLYNSCTLLYNGKQIAQYAKQCLPNYGVFDEGRYFIPGQSTCVVPIHQIPVGIVICEDLWKLGPTANAVRQGAKLILSPNASPFESDKFEKRVSILSKRAKQHHIPIVYANHVSGQDELIFDGGSMVINSAGEVAQLAPFFKETLMPVDIEIDPRIAIETSIITVPDKLTRIYQALVFSLREYVEKNDFPGVILGVSGGIDSALTLAIAVDALGKDRVQAVFMPSRYSADISLLDANELTHHLEVASSIISIEPTYQSILDSLAPSFLEKKPDLTEENIQARCRAILLMALSNKFGHLVLTTGNRSELAVGYCTLYGDMAGGFAVLKDIPKTLVYELAQYRNQIHPVIPQRTIDRPPTAELAPDQTDADTLPPYPLLDLILECYINRSQSIDEIVAQGVDKEIVSKVIALIHRNEYKRKQSAIGPHINHKSFGKDWRYPLTSGFKG